MPQPGPPRILELVDDLVALLVEVLPDEVDVLDGPATSQEHLADELVVVGLTDDASTPGYTSTLTRQDGLGRTRYVEAFTVHCAISMWAGDTDVAERRARTRELLALLHDALDGSTLAGGDAQEVRLGSELALIPVQSPDGAALTTVFDVVGIIAL